MQISNMKVSEPTSASSSSIGSPIPSEVNQMDIETESGSSRTPILPPSLATSILDDLDDSMDCDARYFVSTVNKTVVRDVRLPPSSLLNEPREPTRPRTRTSSFPSIHAAPPIKRPKTPDVGFVSRADPSVSSNSGLRFGRSSSSAAPSIPSPTASVSCSSRPAQAVPHEDPEIESWLETFRVSLEIK